MKVLFTLTVFHFFFLIRRNVMKMSILFFVVLNLAHAVLWIFKPEYFFSCYTLISTQFLVVYAGYLSHNGKRRLCYYKPKGYCFMPVLLTISCFAGYGYYFENGGWDMGIAYVLSAVFLSVFSRFLGQILAKTFK